MRPRPGHDFCEFLPAFLGPVQKTDGSSDVYNFGIGDIRDVPGYDKLLQEVFLQVLPHAAEYLMRLPGQQGFAPLCEELARIHSRISGRQFEKERVLLTEGGCSGISIALAAVQEPGTKVAYAVPSFPYWCTLDSAGFESVPVSFHDPEEYAATYGDRLREAAESDRQIRAVILNEPQNPMGFPLDESQLRVIGELADEHDLQVIVDDVGIAFAFRTDGWPARYIDESRCYVVGSFTKQYAVPGLRLGWLIPPPSQMAAARSIVANLRAGVCNLAAVFGHHLLCHLRSTASEGLAVNEIRRRVEDTRILAQQVSRHVRLWIPGQGLYLLGSACGSAFDSGSQVVTALRRNGVILLDHKILFPPEFHNQESVRLFRISIGGESRTQPGLVRLRDLLTGN